MKRAHREAATWVRRCSVSSGVFNIDPSVTQYAKANLREGMRATRDVI